MAEDCDPDDFDDNDMAWKATPEAERKRLFVLASAAAKERREREEAKKTAESDKPEPTA